MTPTPIHKSEAFTLIELLLVVVVVAVLAALLLPFLSRAKGRSPRISCVDNLKQIGTAYRIWENDHNERYPASQSVTSGGWSDVLTNSNQGSLCWTNYAIMANELGQSPKLLICPSEERNPADTFSNSFSNTNLSYFVGVSANDTQPQSLLCGDRNLGTGNEPDPNYGFSPESGKGNDVAIATNAQVCWSLKMHSAGNAAGAGNIMLGDGSAQQCTSASFRVNCLSHADPTTNWPVGHVPSSPSIRVLFP